MEETARFGLIGKNISYSFSKKYFEQKFQKLFLKNHSYDLFDLQSIEEIENIFSLSGLKGLNVTIPYKESIIPYLDELSDEAEKIGAVNCIAIKNGKKTGYNTDAYGFEKSLLIHKNHHHQSALVLGNGGASKAVQYVLHQHKIPFQIVARTAELNFETITKELVEENKIIVQSTPVGTFPKVEDCLPFPFEGISENHLVIDLIYNPEVSTFLQKASEKGSKTMNGFYMLEQQAEKAWEIWRFQ